ncbi:hypothetical protein MMC29_006072, partial [Sticta canariensis]|nr:hypothetical protein [Sticta canariensis]
HGAQLLDRSTEKEPCLAAKICFSVRPPSKGSDDKQACWQQISNSGYEMGYDKASMMRVKSSLAERHSSTATSPEKPSFKALPTNGLEKSTPWQLAVDLNPVFVFVLELGCGTRTRYVDPPACLTEIQVDGISANQMLDLTRDCLHPKRTHASLIAVAVAVAVTDWVAAM